ncbi:MAG: 1-deoxy-D-xylulose-5-phosphate reductoisomerase, partial [Bacteroidetes bacterium]|nr:1-deoxy-D-xylulose-5-phosphate reductoisomerase [Bacteroidota bacterium]
DGSMKAQMGLPDMKLPIQYALTYPMRLTTSFPRFNFLDYPQLTFEQADRTTFRNLNLAYKAMDMRGTVACTLNAANEIAVDAFLNKRISFLEIAQLNEEVMNANSNTLNPKLDDYITADVLAREKANDLLK